MIYICFYFLSFTEVDIPKSVDDRIYSLYLDPTGRHLIISMLSSENYYLARAAKKPRPLGKLKVCSEIICGTIIIFP